MPASRTRRAPQPTGTPGHLCGSSVRESARSSPAYAEAISSSRRPKAPYAPSTCSQRPSAAQTSARSSSGSIAPVLVVPALAATANGRRPAARSSAIAAGIAASVEGAYAGRADAEQLRGLAQATVAAGRDVEDETARDPVLAVVPAVFDGGGVPGGGQRGEGRARPAAGQQPGAHRIPDELGQPPQHPVFEVHARVVAAGAARPHDGGGQLGERARRVRRRVDPGEEARMAVAHREGEDVTGDRVDQFVACRAFRGEWRSGQPRLLVVVHFSVDGALRQVAEIVGEEVDQPVAGGAELLRGHGACSDQLPPSGTSTVSQPALGTFSFFMPSPRPCTQSVPSPGWNSTRHTPSVRTWATMTVRRPL